jgi:hypothetical protein
MTTSTVVKVADLKMDIYQPDQSVDSETARLSSSSFIPATPCHRP